MAELPVCNICKCSANSEVTHSGNFAFHYNNHCPWAGARMSEEQWTKLMGQGDAVAILCRETGEGADQDWFNYQPLKPGSALHNHRNNSSGWQTLAVYAHPAPAVDDGVVRDAARYRWLREKARAGEDAPDGLYIGVDSDKFPGRWALYESQADKAIDAARKEQQDAKPNKG